ncbi:MAG: 4Fe-4S binding protein, partial [Desulfuromonadales bacterium]
MHSSSRNNTGPCSACPCRRKDEKIVKIVVDPKKCKASGECVRVCPQDAITIVDGVAVIDHDRCDLDGICIP